MPKDQLKSFRLPLRIAQNEADHLMGKALESGLSFTNFLRSRLLFDIRA